MRKPKIYRPKSGLRFMSLQELEARGEVRDKVLDTLKNWMGTHTIPEIAERVGASEDDVAAALRLLCLPELPEVIMAGTKGEAYWRKLQDLYDEAARLRPTFTDRDEFYHEMFR